MLDDLSLLGPTARVRRAWMARSPARTSRCPRGSPRPVANVGRAAVRPSNRLTSGSSPVARMFRAASDRAGRYPPVGDGSWRTLCRSFSRSALAFWAATTTCSASRSRTPKPAALPQEGGLAGRAVDRRPEVPRLPQRRRSSSADLDLETDLVASDGRRGRGRTTCRSCCPEIPRTRCSTGRSPTPKTARAPTCRPVSGGLAPALTDIVYRVDREPRGASRVSQPSEDRGPG